MTKSQLVFLSSFCLAMLSGLFSIGLAQASVPDSDGDQRNVVIMLGEHLSKPLASGHLQIQPGQFVGEWKLKSACRLPGVRHHSLLLYWPESDECELISPMQRTSLSRRIEATTGKRLPSNLMEQLQPGPLVVETAGLVQSARGESCSCPGNNAPEGSLNCSSQASSGGSRIAAINLQANDADGDSLNVEFSHQLNAGPIESGLPEPLTSSCVSNSGNVECAINGLAPNSDGELQLLVEVTDGASPLNLSALLQLTSLNGEPLFNDRLEMPVCL